MFFELAENRVILKYKEEVKMKRLFGIFLLILCLTLGMCVIQSKENKEFEELPELILENVSASGGVVYNWTHSKPRSDSYELYWQKGFSSQEAIIEEGTLIKNPERQGLIGGLTDGDFICALLVAKKADTRTLVL